MKQLLIILLAGVFPLSGWSNGAVLEAAGPALVAGENEAPWRPLLQALAEKGAVEATFTEQRWFSFRRDPVVLTGEMRMSPEHGLSLRYVEPEEKMMIVDRRGIVLRNARGRSRAVKPDPRAPNTGEALLRVLRFDLPGLAKDFEVHAARADEAWRFDFVPRDPRLTGGVGTITVWGSGEAVQHLEMVPKDGPRIEIVIDSAKENVVFTAAELKRYFR